jgi:hypothetical protein
MRAVHLSPFDTLEACFRLLTTGPEPLALDGRNVGYDVSARRIPLGELRILLQHPAVTDDLQRAVLHELVRLATQHHGSWTIGLAGVLLPGLRNIAGSAPPTAGNGLRPAPDDRPRRGGHSFELRPPASSRTDFFTVETVRLETLYLLFFSELGSRRVRLGGVTDHPSGPWVVQRTRELSIEMEWPEATTAPRFLVRDRDSKFTRAFDDIFAVDGIQIIKTPVQAPNANAYAERWVRTVRQECPDWMLIWGRRHLERVLDEYVRRYNHERPHRRLDLRPRARDRYGIASARCHGGRNGGPTPGPSRRSRS